MATVDMLVGQKVIMALVKTKSGIDADIVGAPRWVTSNDAIVGVNPTDDGLTCEVTAKSVGSATVTATAQGATALNANHTIAVTAVSTNLATSLGITVQQAPD